MPSLAGVAKKAAPNVGDARPDAGSFDLLHPRLRAGSGDKSGEFVDVLGKLKTMGAKWEAGNGGEGTWIIPVDRRLEVEGMLDGIGANIITAPAGSNMQLATDEDRKRLSIPPAWTDVLVDSTPGAALVVVGKDGKGRQQSVYSKEHHERQAAEKFARLRGAIDLLPGLDAAIERDRDNDDAAAMMLLRRTGMRMGSKRNTGADKQAFGVSNLQRQHVTIDGDTVRLRFVGKKGVNIDLEVEDPELAAMLRPRMKGPKRGDLFDTNETKMRAWLADQAPGLRPKDLRTIMAGSTALSLMEDMPPPTTQAEFKRRRNQIGDAVAKVLGNTRTMALGGYIDPQIFASWQRGVSDVPPGVRANVRLPDTMTPEEVKRALQQAQAPRKRVVRRDSRGLITSIEET